jgi:orotidine-5'-phosphate decarboxylase
VGLDPRLHLLPKKILTTAQQQLGSTQAAAGLAILEFNKQVLDAIAQHTAVVKLQSAFFEQYGPAGVTAFWETIKYAKSLDLPVIADIKRGDIGSTATAYAHAYLGGVDLFGKTQTTDIDAITVNPFLGADSLEPFFSTAKKQQKGIFVLVKTSNPGSGDIQDLKSNQQTISDHVADMLDDHQDQVDEHGYSNIGAVIGATYPETAQHFRKKLPQAIFLVPGIGAQGGDPSMIKHFFNKDGLGAIVSSSRGVVFSYQENEKQFKKVISEAARDTKILINGNL